MSGGDFLAGAEAERQRCSNIVATALDMNNTDVPADVMLRRILRLVVNGPAPKPPAPRPWWLRVLVGP